MGKHEKKAYLQQIKPRYKKASKAEKKRILDEFCAVCGYNRKYAIRVLNRRKPPKQHHQSGRNPSMTATASWSRSSAFGWPPIRCAPKSWRQRCRCGYLSTMMCMKFWKMLLSNSCCN